jgi:NADH-quinone oxidoreductase subunit L
MDLAAHAQLPLLLGLAWLTPLASFVAILFFGPRMGPHGKNAAWVATAAIVTSLVLSLTAFIVWLGAHPVAPAHHGGHGDHAAAEPSIPAGTAYAAEDSPGKRAHDDGHAGHTDGHHDQAAAVPVALSGDWYTLYEGGRLKLSIGWYIDALTVLMFVVVTFIATCIHIYASGYMHDELHEVTDHEVTLADGHHLHRPGRFPRFFQALSLFCFSMLGIVIAGNLAMVFVFWELVGICSWFLIGFYYERTSASTAANKAFIVNRVGDFGMLIGLMALWGALGTLHFADTAAAGPDGAAVTTPGLFSLFRPAETGHQLQVPDGMVTAGAATEVATIAADHASSPADGASEIAASSSSRAFCWICASSTSSWDCSSSFLASSAAFSAVTTSRAVLSTASG